MEICLLLVTESLPHKEYKVAKSDFNVVHTSQSSFFLKNQAATDSKWCRLSVYIACPYVFTAVHVIHVSLLTRR
jgi:hypothetical protein